MSFTKYCVNCRKFVQYDDEGKCPNCNQVFQLTKNAPLSCQLWYCPTCKKFTQINTFFNRCSVCKKMYPQKYYDSFGYYLKWKDDPDFHEKEKNYDQEVEKVKRQFEKDKLDRERAIKEKVDKNKGVIWHNISSAESLPGKTVVRSIGLVSGTSKHNSGGFIGEGYGKAGDLYMRGSVESATRKMVESALYKGANGIICCKTDTSQDNLNNIIVTVTGTAVVVEDKVEESNIQNTEHFSAADEILKYKQLLDMGAITEEEFEKKKKQLLNL